MLLETKKDKGRAGVALAIAYFGSNGYTVSVPLNDTQDYDLIIDKNNILSRVSVKFTGRKVSINYSVELRSCGGTNGAVVYSDFISSSAHYLFVLTENNTMYFIPKEAITTKTRVTLNSTFDNYIVTI